MIILLNSFIVDFDSCVLMFDFNKSIYKFDLTKGDRGDFWSSITTSGGISYDVNFYYEEGIDHPMCTLYAVRKGEIDTAESIELRFQQSFGDEKNYLEPDRKNLTNLEIIADALHEAHIYISQIGENPELTEYVDKAYGIAMALQEKKS